MVLPGTCNTTQDDCLSPSIRDPWETDYAAVVPRFSGSLSAISSAVIIYVILRSEKGLSSIYHRIMFGMSIADILGSSAIALTSLPMPSYMYKEKEFGYYWAGTRLGNTYTCNAQGFFASFGPAIMFSYNATLCIFYTCSIAFNMREQKIRRYVEPIIHGLPVLVGLSYAVPPLFLEMYNPGITSYAWCAPLPYPDECVYQDVQCVRGSPKAMNFLMMMLRCFIPTVFSIIVVSMVLIIWKVTSQERLLHKMNLAVCNKMNYCSNIEYVVKRHSFTKVVAYQATAYILALLLSLLLPLFRAMNVVLVTDDSQSQWEKIYAIDKAILVLLPLQGFFNLIIFLSHKIYNYCRASNSGIGICQVLNLLFLQKGTHEPVFISRISIVRKEQGDLGDDNDDIGVNHSFCNDGNWNDCREMIPPQNLSSGGRHHRLHDSDHKRRKRDLYEFAVIEDDNDEETLRFRIRLFQDSQSQEGQIDCDPPLPLCETIDTEATCIDPREETCIIPTNLSHHISISSGNDVDVDNDISYGGFSYSPRLETSFTSSCIVKEEPQRKYYHVSTNAPV